jgi:hypothetical protein
VDTNEDSVIKGEFFTDGKTFILQLADSPLAGVGTTAQEAFQNLIDSRSDAAGLSSRIRALAREQQGERVRAGIVRTVMGGLIAVGIIAGAIIVTAAIAPRVVSEIAVSASMKLIDRITPEREEKLARALQHLRALVDGTDKAGAPPQSAQPATPK